MLFTYCTVGSLKHKAVSLLNMKLHECMCKYTFWFWCFKQLDLQIYRSWDNCYQLVSPSSADMKYEHFSMRIVMASTTSVSADSAPVDSTETIGLSGNGER